MQSVDSVWRIAVLWEVPLGSCGNTGGSRPHTPMPGAKATQLHGTHEHGLTKTYNAAGVGVLM